MKNQNSWTKTIESLIGSFDKNPLAMLTLVLLGTGISVIYGAISIWTAGPLIFAMYLLLSAVALAFNGWVLVMVIRYLKNR